MSAQPGRAGVNLFADLDAGRNHVVRLYDRLGWSIRQTAAACGVSYGTARTILAEHGVLRPHGGTEGPVRARAAGVDMAAARRAQFAAAHGAAYTGGESAKSIAVRTSRTPAFVSRALREAGIARPTRTRAEAS